MISIILRLTSTATDFSLPPKQMGLWKSSIRERTSSIEAPHSMLYRDDLKRLCVVDGDASEIKETGEKLFFTPDLPLIAFVSC